MFSGIWGRDSPPALDADRGEAAVLLKPMEVHGGPEIHLPPVEDPMPEQRDAQRVCDAVLNPCQTRLLAGHVA